MNELHLTKKDFTIQWFSGTGAGGQYRNKHQNCCRIIHNDTKLVGIGQRHRERTSNQRDAFNLLASKLIAYYDDDEPIRERITETIRTYHEPRNTVKDHVSGETSTYKNVVVDGNIDEMIAARHKKMCDKVIEEK